MLGSPKKKRKAARRGRAIARRTKRPKRPAPGTKAPKRSVTGRARSPKKSATPRAARTPTLRELLDQRTSELAVINSIQQGIAGSLDFQGIIDLADDKLREVFQTGDMGMAWYDDKDNLLTPLYGYEHGKRLSLKPWHPDLESGSSPAVLRDRRPYVRNSVAEMEAARILTIPGTDTSMAMLRVPMVAGDRVIGIINIENHERENAFGEAEVRLLTTVASSLGVALENARLFDETQRLLKETEQRNAELAIINAVQQGLAAELDFKAIIDLVGDKIAEIFRAPTMAIALLDK